MSDLVIFGLDSQRYALDLQVVERIVPAVEVARLPSAPPVVIGIINVGGTLIPVLNIRHRFQLPERNITVRDQFLIARTSLRSVVLVIDEALGVIECPDEEVVDSDEVLPDMKYVRGVIRLRDGLVFIHDLDSFLSLEEQLALEDAMKQGAADGG